MDTTDSEETSTIINLDDNVKYLVVNTKDVKGVNNEADLEKAAEYNKEQNKYYANVSYYKENDSSDAVLVVIDSTGKWYTKSDKANPVITNNTASTQSTPTTGK